MCGSLRFFFFSRRSRHTRCALVTGVQTCALPIYATSGLAVLQSARPVIDRNWKALTSLPGWANQPGSARLADAKEQADVALDKLTEILSQGGDRDTLDFFVTGSLYSFIDPQIGRASCRASVWSYV